MKLRCVIFILSAFCCIFVQAQDAQDTKENILLTVSYDCDQLCDYPNQWRNADWRKTSALILEIGEQVAHSYIVAERNHIQASLERFQEKNAWRLDINIHALLGETYMGYPSKGKLTQVVNLDAAGVFQYTEDIPNLKWKLHPDHKEVLGYDCQKATCSFRGRDYEAWFAMAIPMSYGPWKLQGLPGLILEVYDTKNEYHFTATGIEKPKGEKTITWNYASLRSIKRAKALKMEAAMHRDHGVFAADYGITFRLGNGLEHKAMPYHPIELK